MHSKTILTGAALLVLVSCSAQAVTWSPGLVLGSGRLDQVVLQAPGPQNGIKAKKITNKSPQHWNPGAKVGPFPVGARQSPDGPGAPDLPPILAELCIFIGNTKPCKAEVIVNPKPPVVPPVVPPVIDPEPPTVQPIPVPASLPLLLGALAGLGLLRRRRG